MFPETYPIRARFRSTGVTNTATAIKASPGRLHRLAVTNRHSAAIFLKLYDALAAGVTVGTTAPVNVIQVAANSQVILHAQEEPYNFATGITVAAVTGAADNDATAPATLPIIEAETA